MLLGPDDPAEADDEKNKHNKIAVIVKVFLIQNSRIDKLFSWCLVLADRANI